MILRELRPADAAALFQAVSRADVSRFISPPPAKLEGVQRFIAWASRERAAGRSFCFGVVETRWNTLVGLFQVRALKPSFRVAEWGFALAPAYWGTGLFLESAVLVLEFVFGELGVDRLEARAALGNSRGNAVLRKLGAEQEGILRRSFKRDGEYLDEALWTLLASDWARSKCRARPEVRH